MGAAPGNSDYTSALPSKRVGLQGCKIVRAKSFRMNERKLSRLLLLLATSTQVAFHTQTAKAIPFSDNSPIQIKNSYFDGVKGSSLGTTPKQDGYFLVCPDGTSARWEGPKSNGYNDYLLRGVKVDSKSTTELKKNANAEFNAGAFWWPKENVQDPAELAVSSFTMTLLIPKDLNKKLSKNQQKLIYARYLKKDPATKNPYTLIKTNKNDYILQNNEGKKITIAPRSGGWGAIIDSSGTKLEFSNKFLDYQKRAHVYCSKKPGFFHTKYLRLLDLTIKNDGRRRELSPAILIIDLFQKGKKMSKLSDTTL